MGKLTELEVLGCRSAGVPECSSAGVPECSSAEG